MKLERPDNSTLRFSELDEFLYQLLRLVPQIADNTHDARVKKRFFQQPAKSQEENDEWCEYVHPELDKLFLQATALMQQDLGSEPDAGADQEESRVIDIPLDHADAWLNCLNRARLALAEQYNLDEADINHDHETELASSRQLAIFQVHFYGYLQECILHELDEQQ